MISSLLLILGLTLLIHLDGLWAIKRNTKHFEGWPRLGLAVIVILSIQLHVAEIGCFALSYQYADALLGIGHLTFADPPGFLDCFYYSAETFTALGYGDVTATGDLRLVAVSEPLVGLTLISWSGAYTFIAMQRFWKDQRERFPRGKPPA